MDNWFSINLGDAMLASESLARLEEHISLAYTSAGSPNDMATFYRHESEGRLHCELKIYLSPSSVAVAREINAEQCEKPSPYGLSILAGSPDSWLALFPEHSR